MKNNDHKSKIKKASKAPIKTTSKKNDSCLAPKEVGGREGPDPTRYGDWEKNGRCIDF